MVTGIATGTATDEAAAVVVEMTTGNRTDETVVTVMCVSSFCLFGPFDVVANESIIIAS